MKTTHSKGSSEKGVSLVEYAVLLAFLSAVCLVCLKSLGQKVSAKLMSGALEI